METKRQQDAEPRPPAPARPQGTQTVESPAAGLDFAKLDLSVERIEERISPSETNVFDK